MKSFSEKTEIEMASNSRGGLHSNRHSGRSPPFILIGLLVVIAILSFNYWSASSTNRELEENIKSIQTRYTETSAKYNTQGSELKSIKQENDGHKTRVQQLEADLNLKTNEHEDIKKNLDVSAQNIARLNNEYETLQTQFQQQIDSHDEELDDCERERESQLKEKDNALAVCQGEKAEFDQAKLTLQSQISDLQSQFNSKTCEGEVSTYRTSLLTKLQDLGGPDVLLGLQKVGVDISGVQLSSNWQPPQNAKQEQVANAAQAPVVAPAEENGAPAAQGYQESANSQNFQPDPAPANQDQSMQEAYGNQDNGHVVPAVDQSQGGMDGGVVGQQGLAPQVDGGNQGYQQVPPGRFEAAPIGDQAPAQGQVGEQPAIQDQVGYQPVNQEPNQPVNQEPNQPGNQQQEFQPAQVDQQFQPVDQQFQPVDQQFQPVDRQIDQQIAPADQQIQPADQQFQPVDQQVQPADQQFQRGDQQIAPPADQQLQPLAQQIPAAVVNPLPPVDRVVPAAVDGQVWMGGERGAVVNADNEEIGDENYDDEDEDGDDFGRDDLQRARADDFQEDEEDDNALRFQAGDGLQ